MPHIGTVQTAETGELLLGPSLTAAQLTDSIS